MNQYRVKARGTSLNFEGIKIATASSRGNDPRWIEFTLYKAATGQYVVERVGKTTVFHRYDCEITQKNGLDAVEYDEIPGGFVPCLKCKPSRIDPEGLFPERERPYFQTCDKPEGVVKFLERKGKYDDLMYLTNVARDLLTEASEHDTGIYNVYIEQKLE